MSKFSSFLPIVAQIGAVAGAGALAYALRSRKAAITDMKHASNDGDAHADTAAPAARASLPPLPDGQIPVHIDAAPASEQAAHVEASTDEELTDVSTLNARDVARNQAFQEILRKDAANFSQLTRLQRW